MQFISRFPNWVRFCTLATLSIFAFQVVTAQQIDRRAAEGQQQTVTVDVFDDTVLSDVKRLGINLGARDQFGAGNYLKNWIPNPGFESAEFATVFIADAGGTGNRIQADNWDINWNNETFNIGQLPGFWNGAEVEVVSGNAQWRRSTVADFVYENDRYVFYLTDSGEVVNQGDVFFVRLQTQGKDPDLNAYNRAETGDIRPNSPGAQSLRLMPPEQEWQASYQQGFDTFHRSNDPGAGKLSIVDGNWQFEVWAKATTPGDTLHVLFQRQGEVVFFDETYELNNEWQKISAEFSVPDGTDELLPYSPERPRNAITFEFRIGTSSGDILVDDVELKRADYDNPTVFSDKLVDRLQELQPGIIRNWGSQLGSSLDNQLAGQFERKPTGFMPSDRTGSGYHYSLHEFLQLSQLVNAEPWYVVPPTFSTDDMQNLAAYLSAPAGSHPYADLRANLGQDAPWTDVFSQIHLEYGNELWGSNGGGFFDPFMGASMRGGWRAARVAQDRIGIYKGSGNYIEPKINFVLGGQTFFPPTQSDLENNSSNHDTIGLAPYFARTIDDYSSNQNLYYPLYAHAQWVTSNSYVTESIANVNAVGQGTGMAVYELNLHWLSGDAPLDTRNNFNAGLGGALALPLTMMHYQEDLGVRDLLAYRALQFSKETDETQEYARLWGMLRDLEATGRKRPTWLATELANMAIQGDLIRTETTNAPNWLQVPVNELTEAQTLPLVQTFAYRDGDQYAMVIYNLHDAFAQDVVLNVPTMPDAPATIHRLTGDHIGANNEDAENVRITMTNIDNFAQGYSVNMPPHSMAVVKWTTGGNAVNRPPTAQMDGYVAVAGEQIIGNVLANDSDANGDSLTARLGNNPSQGSLTLNEDGSFTYTANGDASGSDSFTYFASDGEFDSAETIVTITILDADSPKIYLPILRTP